MLETLSSTSAVACRRSIASTTEGAKVFSIDRHDHLILVLAPRSDMTAADRALAACYQARDILHYVRGSKEHGIESGSYAQVVGTNPKENLVTVRKENGQQATYDPARLRGISAYNEIKRDFAIGDRIQLTAPKREQGVANRAPGTIQHIDEHARMIVRTTLATARLRFLFLAARIWRHAGCVGVSYSDHYQENHVFQRRLERLRSVTSGPDRFAPVLPTPRCA